MITSDTSTSAHGKRVASGAGPSRKVEEEEEEKSTAESGGVDFWGLPRGRQQALLMLQSLAEVICMPQNLYKYTYTYVYIYIHAYTYTYTYIHTLYTYTYT